MTQFTLLTVHTIGLWAVLITTSLRRHDAMTEQRNIWNGMMALQAGSDERSPKTNGMNSKKSKEGQPTVTTGIAWWRRRAGVMSTVLWRRKLLQLAASLGNNS